MFKRLRKYLDKRYVIQAVGAFDETGIIGAVENSDAKSLGFLLEAGINADAVNERGVPALCCGVKKGSIPILKMLLEGGAQIDIPDTNGKTPLMYAVESGNKHVLNFILTQHPELEAEDKDNETALIKAARIGKTTLVQELLDAGAEVDAVNHAGETALMIAIDHLRTGVVKALLMADADPNCKDKEGHSALDRPGLSPRITQMLKKSAQKHRRQHIQEDMQLSRRESGFGQTELTKQVNEIGGFIFGMLDAAIQNLDKNGTLEHLEIRGKELLTQLQSVGPANVNASPDFLQEHLKWLLEILMEMRTIALLIRKLPAEADPNQHKNLQKFQLQISTAIKQFSEFLSQQQTPADLDSSHKQTDS